jgi:uncharacterized protein YjbJ (UPF0337 family)
MREEDVRGKVKEAAGKLTDDEALERQGNRDQAKGEIKKAGDKIKDAAEHAKDSVTSR